MYNEAVAQLLEVQTRSAALPLRSARSRRAPPQTGHAYRCFCSADRLQALRERQARVGAPSMYDRHCLHLPAGEAEARAAAGEPHTVRLQVPRGTTVVEDAVRRHVSFSNSAIDDQVLLKSDGFPTYHLACVVDDHHMQISHVLRGEVRPPWAPGRGQPLTVYVTGLSGVAVVHAKARAPLPRPRLAVAGAGPPAAATQRGPHQAFQAAGRRRCRGL